MLHQGEGFCVELKYHADEDISNLQLACSLTDKSGQVITGQRFPSLVSAYRPSVPARASAVVSTSMAGCRLESTFSMPVHANCPEKIYLHRLVDGYLLRVLLPRTTNYGFGIVDLTSTTPELTGLKETDN